MTSKSHADREAWTLEQQRLKQLVIEEDAVDWVLPRPDCCPDQGVLTPDARALRLVGGVDISFFPDNEGAWLPWYLHVQQTTSRLTVRTLLLYAQDLRVVYEDLQPLPLTVPYIPGFLAFREVPAYQQLLRRVRAVEGGRWVPQALLVDGCGVLHPAGCGSACHLGVTEDVPTVGVAKKLLVVDGLERHAVEGALAELQAETQGQGDGRPDQAVLPLVGASGRTWGAALAHGTSRKPLYVSVGHRLSLTTALRLVQACCVHRNPEPVRQADLRSRDAVRRAATASGSSREPCPM